MKHLVLEFSGSNDLLNRFPALSQNHIRYFRGLCDLQLVFPQDISGEDWELLPGQNILSDEHSLSSDIASKSLTRALDWLPSKTKVAVVKANISKNIDGIRKESAMDQKIEDAVLKIIQKYQLGQSPSS